MAEFGDGSPAPERLHALDAVRGFALLLGIVLHATLSFLPAPTRIWIIQDSHPSMTLAVLFFAIHVFRMTTFFLIAGFFAHMSFHRLGGRVFIKDRLQRIALPLVVGWPILFAAMFAAVFWAASFPNGGPVPGASRWPPVLPGFPLTHLWFLYVLLEFYAATLVLRTGMAWLDKSSHIRAQVDRLIGLAMRSPLAPAILAVPIGIALNLDPTWFGWLGVRTPDQSLVTNLQAVFGFGTAFGFMAATSPDRFNPDSGATLAAQSCPRHRLDRGELRPCKRALAEAGCRQVRGCDLLRAGDLDHDICSDRRCPSLLVRLQRYAALYRRCVLLAVSHPPADCDGAAGIGLLPRLAVASQVRDDPAGRRPGHVCQLPTLGTLQRYRSGAEWPSHTKALRSRRVNSKPIVNFLIRLVHQTSNRDDVRSGCAP
jgi:hypothetical protein